MSSAQPVTLFVGDPSVVDPVVQAAIDEVLDRSAQAWNLEVFRHGERPLAEAVLAMRQVGMFAARRCIWIRGWSAGKPRARAEHDADDADEGEGGEDAAAELLALLEEGLPPQTTLFISAASIDARSRLFKYLTKNAKVRDLRVDTGKAGRFDPAHLGSLVEARLKAAGVVSIGPGAVEQIVERSGTNVGEVLQEVDRLVLTLADPRSLTAAHVRDGMRDMAQTWVFDFTKAVSERRLSDAERMIEQLLDDGEPPLRLSALLATHVGGLLEVRPLVDKLPRGALQMHGNQFLAGPMQSLPESFRRRYSGWRGYFRLKEAAAFTTEELLRLHRELVELDLALKSSRTSPVLLFSRLLQTACRVPARGRE